jgi:DNA-binding NtrC family response regulator
VTIADFDHLPAPASSARTASRVPGARRRERPDAAEGRASPDGAPRSAEPSIAIPLGCTLAEAERRIVLASLRHHRTRSRAARALGIGLRTLYTKLAAWGTRAEDAERA